MNIDDKILCLDKLTSCYHRVFYLKLLCEGQGLVEEAARLGRRRARLRLELDELLINIYQDWIGETKKLQEKIDTSNQAVDKSIKDIEHKIQVAQNITKAIGYVDDAITLAADLVP